MEVLPSKYLADADEVLKNIVHTVELSPIALTHSVFHDLMSCILEQQIHYRSTKKIFQKMLQTAQMEMLTPNNFQQFEQTAFANLTLSNSKYETILATVAFFQQHTLDWASMSDENVRKTLAQIKGIGTWTVDMLLLYTLQRPDVFPFDDYHLKQIMVSLYGLNPDTLLKKQMLDIAAPWSPHRSTATIYLLAFKEFQKKAYT
jgi:DNA-3-methyladenine glycosylase II